MQAQCHPISRPAGEDLGKLAGAIDRLGQRSMRGDDEARATIRRGKAAVGIEALLVSLVARLMDPTTGRVLTGGHDLRAYPLEILRRHIGLAPQEPFLFSDTLARNIASIRYTVVVLPLVPVTPVSFNASSGRS